MTLKLAIIRHLIGVDCRKVSWPGRAASNFSRLVRCWASVSHHIKYIAPLVGLFLAGSASAQEPLRQAAISIGVGTFGPTVGLTTDIIPGRLNLNLEYSRVQFDANVSAGGYKGSGYYTLGGAAAVVSYFPLNNPFSIDVGAIINQTRINIGSAQSVQTLSGQTRVSGKSNFNNVAPYIGAGWGNPLTNGSQWSVISNVGFMYQGNPDVQLNGDGSADQIAGAQSSFNHRWQWFSWYPIVSFKLAYRY